MFYVLLLGDSINQDKWVGKQTTLMHCCLASRQRSFHLIHRQRLDRESSHALVMVGNLPFYFNATVSNMSFVPRHQHCTQDIYIMLVNDKIASGMSSKTSTINSLEVHVYWKCSTQFVLNKIRVYIRICRSETAVTKYGVVLFC